jgi:phosphoadenosine phosphosulfate reductase
MNAAILMATSTKSAKSGLTLAEVQRLDEGFRTKSVEEILGWASVRFGARAAIGTSFQGAGIVLMDLAVKAGLRFPVFTLDTGLLFPETIALKARLEDYFGIQIESLMPDLTVEQQAEAIGPELWKSDPDLCCSTRKVLPLQAKLSELDCWITGLRRDQAETRAGLGVIELHGHDAGGERDIVKLNPMAKWSRAEVWKHIQDNKIPYNPLHDQGYTSIGCRPCTLRNTDGKNERGGRWLGFKKVECGIHTFMARKA